MQALLLLVNSLLLTTQCAGLLSRSICSPAAPKPQFYDCVSNTLKPTSGKSYTFLKIIGRGGTGIVALARDAHGAHVAVKFMKRGFPIRSVLHSGLVGFDIPSIHNIVSRYIPRIASLTHSYTSRCWSITSGVHICSYIVDEKYHMGNMVPTRGNLNPPVGPPRSPEVKGVQSLQDSQSPPQSRCACRTHGPRPPLQSQSCNMYPLAIPFPT